MRKALALVVGFALVLAASACSIDDWTGYGFNSRNTFNNIGGPQVDQLNLSNVGSLHRIWTFNDNSVDMPTSNIVTFSDSMTNTQRAYVVRLDEASNQPILYALNVATGRIEWVRVTTAVAYYGSGTDLAVSSRRVAVVGTRDGYPTFARYDVTTGAVSYASALPQTVADYPGTLTMVDDWAYTGGTSVDKTWVGTTPCPISPCGWHVTTPNAVSSPPAVYNGVVYATAGNIVYALRDTTGAVLWTRAVTDNGSLGVPLVAPTVNGQNVPTLYVAGTKVWALNLATGVIRWSGGSTASGYTGITITNNQLLATHDNVVQSLNATSGNQQYARALPLAGDWAEQPITANGVVYVSGHSGSNWMPTEFAYRASDGALLKTMAVTDLLDPGLYRAATVSEGLVLLPTASGIEAWGL